MENSLNADSLIVSYNGRTVICGACVDCRPGDIIGLFGRNGSGKSTLLKAIFGTVATEGKYVCIDGRVQTKPAYTSGKLCYLPQDCFLPTNITIRQIICYYVSEEYREEVMSDCCMARSLDKYGSELSGGEFRYIEIMVVLFGKARYLFLDEPFNGLAPICVEKILDYIRAVSSRKGIVLVSHSIPTLLSIINRAMVLSNGTLRELKQYDHELIISVFLADRNNNLS